jgi:hypothetical protein
MYIKYIVLTHPEGSPVVLKVFDDGERLIVLEPKEVRSEKLWINKQSQGWKEVSGPARWLDRGEWRRLGSRP